MTSSRGGSAKFSVTWVTVSDEVVKTARCSCTGSTCGCSITPGAGVNVTGTGTAADPFILSVNPTGLNIGSTIAVASTPSIELYKNGTGSAGDPLILTGKVILVSPGGTRYTLAVSNTGVLSATTTGT